MAAHSIQYRGVWCCLHNKKTKSLSFGSEEHCVITWSDASSIWGIYRVSKSSVSLWAHANSLGSRHHHPEKSINRETAATRTPSSPSQHGSNQPSHDSCSRRNPHHPISRPAEPRRSRFPNRPIPPAVRVRRPSRQTRIIRRLSEPPRPPFGVNPCNDSLFVMC